VPYVPSTTLVVRRDAIGVGFDERLRVGEDVDLVWRIAASGWGVLYDPAATVRHEHRTSARGFAARRLQYAMSIGLLAARHPAALPALRVDASTAVVLVALMRRPRLAVGLAAVVFLRMHRATRHCVRHPVRLAMTLGLRSLVAATRRLAFAIRRPWWPLCALAAMRSRRWAALLAAAYGVGLVESRPARPSHAALSLVDDVISGTGTWWSCLRRGILTPLLPVLDAYGRPTGFTKSTKSQAKKKTCGAGLSQ
jgi:hypothetical protein